MSNQDPFKKFKPRSTFCPYDKGGQIETFKMVMSELENLTNKKEYCNNMSKHEMQTLNALKKRDDIVIKNADRESGGVLS